MKNVITSILVFTSMLANAQTFQLVKNVNQTPDNGGLNVNCSFKEMGGKLYYIFSDQASGKKALFVSDGTTIGTNIISPSNVNVEGNIIIGGNKIYFFATDGVNGKEPWVSDGTTSGTQMLKNIHATTNDLDFETSESKFLSADATKAFFIANDGTTGAELWVTDGTTLGTVFVSDIFQGTTGSAIEVAPSGIGTNMKNGKLYFFAVDGSGGFTVHGREPWISDGTGAGTFMLQDIQTGFNESNGSSNTKHFVEYNGKMYFFAAGTLGKGLWETDGTTLGTQLVYNTTIYRIDEFLVHNNLIYFTNSNGPALYTSDGTNSGTVFIDSIPNGQLNNIATSQMVVANNSLFMRVVGNPLGKELFMLNGSNQIVLVKDINTTVNVGGLSGNIYQDKKIFQVYQNRLWFLASDGSQSGALQMWNSDGTNVGTVALSPLNNDGGFAGGNGNNYNIYATTFGMFMIYFNPTTGAELYKYDQTTGVLDNISTNNAFNIYPNPTNKCISINSTLSVSNYQITNTLGQLIQSDKFNNQPIDIGNLNSGIYFISITTSDDKIFSRKILKE